MRLSACVLLASNVLLAGAPIAKAQNKQFDTWVAQKGVVAGDLSCSMSSQLSNSTQAIEIEFGYSKAGELLLILREADWKKLPDGMTAIATVTFNTAEFTHYSRSFRAVKSDQSILVRFDPAESSHLIDGLRSADRMTINLARTADANSTTISEPMLSEIKLPWLVGLGGTPPALAEFIKCHEEQGYKTGATATTAPPSKVTGENKPVLSAGAPTATPQSLDFTPWTTVQRNNTNGEPICYLDSKLSDPAHGIEVNIGQNLDYSLAMVLSEADWATLPDGGSFIVKVTFYTDKLEQYSHRFRAGKQGKLIMFGFGPTESGYVLDWLRVSTTMTIDLVRTKDKTSTTPSEPMLSGIKLPWTIKMVGSPEALVQLKKCNDERVQKTRPKVASSPKELEEKKQLLQVMYITYAIADRCAAADAGFNKAQVSAMQNFVKTQVAELKLSQAENDQMWVLVQGQVTGMSLTHKDCADTRQQAGYMFSQTVFQAGGQKNPF